MISDRCAGCRRRANRNRTTSAVLQAWREEQGDILAFLPGVGEIERVRGWRRPGWPLWAATLAVLVPLSVLLARPLRMLELGAVLSH